MGTNATTPSGPRISQEERWEIADQLTRVLTSPWFRTSSRCSQLLRHVVEVAIHGQTDRLKERQIAIEAFHRKPTYDNNADPVVRVAAGEVRKRLAQYYGDAENLGQIRIELPIGSYVPVFHMPGESAAAPESEPPVTQGNHGAVAEEAAVAESPTAVPHTGAAHVVSRNAMWGFAVAAAILLVAGLGVWRMLRPTPQLSQLSGFDAFWAPVISSGQPTLISVGEFRTSELTFVSDVERSRLPSSFQVKIGKSSADGIAVQRPAYSRAAAEMASVLGAKNKLFDVRGQTETSLADISGRSTILLGSYDNDWVLGVTEGMPLQFKVDTARDRIWISDSRKPGQEIGALSISGPEPSTYEAFSLVLRRSGSVSRQVHMVVAGVGDKGTIAAADFISDPRYLNEFAAQHGPKEWAGKNVAFLIQTHVVENVIGIPRVVDYVTW